MRALRWWVAALICAALVSCETPVYGDDDSGSDDDAGDDDVGDDDTGDDDTGDDDTGDDDTAYDDNDGDGWIASLDCDDGDPDVHPDAFDWCGDGVDQDCSGTADDATVQVRPWELIEEPYTYAAPALGDFRGQGLTDVALASYQLSVVLLHNDGAGGIGGSSEVTGPGTALSALGGDFDGDGDPDLVVPLQAGCPMAGYANSGAGSFGGAPAVGCSIAPSWGTVADMDGDGHADLVLVDPVADSMQLLMGQGAFGFAPQPVIEPSIGAFDVALADFDGDAYPDLVLSGGAGGVAALVNDGATLDEAALIGTGWSLEMGTTADLDGDGRDELIAMLADGDLMVATNLGDATFDAPVRYGVPVPGLYASAADLTADGAADVVVCAMDGLSVLINDGTGGLDDSAFLAADVGGSCRATPVDLDGDGHRELLVSAPAQLGWYLLRTCVP